MRNPQELSLVCEMVSESAVFADLKARKGLEAVESYIST